MGIVGLQKCTLMSNWIVKKRYLFDELMQGMDDLKAHREGKLTLKTTEVIPAPELVVTAGEITALREKLGCSQPVFAAMLHTKSKTLKNWEQGRAEPNAQAKVLIKLVQKDHRTLDQLATLT